MGVLLNGLQFFNKLIMDELSKSTNLDSLLNCDSKLFKLNSSGNWDDIGTGRTSITRRSNSIESLNIVFKVGSDSKQIQEEHDEVSKAPASEDSYLFEAVSNFSIESGSILIFVSREKRLALSFRDSDAQFLEFFSASLQTAEEKPTQQLNAGSIINSICKDDNLIQSIKASFYKYQEEEDEASLLDTFNAFKRLLNECNQDFIRIMFNDDNIVFLFTVLEYSPHNTARASYRSVIKDICYSNLLELPPHIQKYAKFNMYLTEFKDVASLIIQPNLEGIIALLMYENSTTIINYLLSNQHIMINFLAGMESNIEKSIKLVIELTVLANSVSVETRTRLYNSLATSANLYEHLLVCLNKPETVDQVKRHSEEVTVFEEIIKIYTTMSGVSTYLFQNFILSAARQNADHQTMITSALVFGYLNGNINLKSSILELLSNVFNPDNPRKPQAPRIDTQESKGLSINCSIHHWLQKTVLSPICKQLFQKSSCEGEQLMMQWISKSYPFFHMSLRRVIIDSRLIKKALNHTPRKSIILLLVLKIVKGMLQIKNVYTVRYFNNSGVVPALQKAYARNKGRTNLIGSLYRSIEEDVASLNYEGKVQRELQRIFQSGQKTTND